ncbi:MAG: hypothetical protein V1934_06640 [Methanobacteriota archaeon]
MGDDKFGIPEKRMMEVNDFLAAGDNPLTNGLQRIIDRHGGVAEINRKHRESARIESLMASLKKGGHDEHVKGLDWLSAQMEKGAFVSVGDYRKSVLGAKYPQTKFDESKPVTLEISALQYFPFLMQEARQAIEKRELMPGRFIRVRMMKEQEADGDLAAVQAAMAMMGASVCETLDTKGTDGSNVHLGGPDTITGYFGGVGQPNDHALAWIDEFLYYHTNFGVKQVLNVNPGTVILGYMLYKAGVDLEFKISVFMGNDNPYSIFWTLMTAKLLSRADGTTPLIGFNLSNSVDNGTIEAADRIRGKFGFTDNVRLEHHITETWKHIVRQPYNRRGELLEVARKVPNISAKHEGGEIATEQSRKHPSDILEYFATRADIEKDGLMPLVAQNYMDKHESVNVTAKALTENGLSFIAAPKLHHR